MLQSLLIPVSSMELGWNCKKPIINVEDTTQIVPLHFPIDVELPETVWTEFQTAHFNSTIKLFAHKRLVSSMMNSAVVQIVQPEIHRERNGSKPSLKYLIRQEYKLDEKPKHLDHRGEELTFSQSFFMAFFFS